jgi:hypothetical protein
MWDMLVLNQTLWAANKGYSLHLACVIETVDEEKVGRKIA